MNELVDLAGGIGSAKSVVDIDDRHAASTAVQHAQKRGDAVEIGSVTDAGGHCNDRARGQACDDGGQGTFHTGDGNDDRGFLQGPGVGEDAVDAGHTDIRQQSGLVAHDLGRDPGFLRHGKITGAGAGDEDEPLSFGQRGGFDRDAARDFVVSGLAEVR